MSRIRCTEENRLKAIQRLTGCASKLNSMSVNFGNIGITKTRDDLLFVTEKIREAVYLLGEVNEEMR